MKESKSGISVLLSLKKTTNQYFGTNYNLLIETLFNDYIRGRDIEPILDMWDDSSKAIILAEVYKKHSEFVDLDFGEEFIKGTLPLFLLSLGKSINSDYLKDHIIYCDESMNVRKVLIRRSVSDELKDRFFTLGGIIVPNNVDLNEIKTLFPEHKNGEFKYDFFTYGRKMPDCLSSDRLSKLLDFLIDNDIKIHFNTKNYIYYGLADIIDTLQISFDKGIVDALKSVFYDYLMHSFDDTYQLLIDFEYPSIPHGKEAAFIERMIDIYEKSLKNAINKNSEEYQLATLLLKSFKRKNSYDMILVQDNDAFVLENSLIQDYIHTASIFIFNGVVFDEEKKIEAELLNIDCSYQKVLNCSFKNSKLSIGIQISDFVAGFISRLISHIAKLKRDSNDDVLANLKKNTKTLENLRKFGLLYSRSNDFYKFSICAIMSRTEKYAFDNLFNSIH